MYQVTIAKCFIYKNFCSLLDRQASITLY